MRAITEWKWWVIRRSICVWRWKIMVRCSFVRVRGKQGPGRITFGTGSHSQETNFHTLLGVTRPG